MIVLGEDVGSRFYGMVIVDGTDVLAKAVWTPPPRVKRPEALLDFHRSKHEWIDQVERALEISIDVAAIEEFAVKRGFKTIRTLSHFESAGMLVNAERKIITISVKAGVARNDVLGVNPNSSKQQALAVLRKRFPDIRWAPIDQGGEDEMDAYVAALAAPNAMRS